MYILFLWSTQTNTFFFLTSGTTKELLRQISKELAIVKASLVVQLVKNLPAMSEIWVQSLGWP